MRLNLTQHGEAYRNRTFLGLTGWFYWLFQDFMGGGAWPFLVRGMSRLDFGMLIRVTSETSVGCSSFWWTPPRHEGRKDMGSGRL